MEPKCQKIYNKDLSRSKSFRHFVLKVQGGFPEAIHSRYVEKYLEKLALRIGCRYTGTIIKGGVEGIQTQPNWMTRKLFQSFYEFGKTFGETGEFDEQIMIKLARPERYSKLQLLILRLLTFRLSNNY